MDHAHQGGGNNRRFTESGREITLGRASSNDIVLGHHSVSAHHARITLADGDAWLEDLSSRNGTFVGHPPRRVTRERIRAGDLVILGKAIISQDVLASALGALPTPPKGASPNQSRCIEVPSARGLLFGRDPRCDVPIASPTASARHAIIVRERGRIVVCDLGSTNGTFIDNARISTPTVLTPGAVLTIAGTQFTLTSDERSLTSIVPYATDTIEAIDLAVEVTGRRLLEGVSLVVQPGELVAIMGPSGAGKSTLLRLINGNTIPSYGHVLIGGIDVHKHYDLFRGRIGYVPQDDIMHSSLTVGQALRFAARLRLPSDFSDQEIERRVAEVISQLGLNGTENVQIGDAHRRGISGGQRKRVNLAMELISDPSTLILDEPTSGLSSADAISVVNLLRRLADAGKTILLTIHQPSLEVFTRFDTAAVIARDDSTSQIGRLAWYGQAWPDALEFFEPIPPGAPPPTTVEGLLRGLSKKPVAAWIQKWDRSEAKMQWVTRRAGRTLASHQAPTQRTTQKNDRFLQWITLIRRALAVKVADRWNTAVLMFQAPLIGFLIATVFSKILTSEPSVETWLDIAAKLATATFVTALAAIWFGCSASAREIVTEWPIYQRERMIGLSIVSYLGSKVVVGIMLACIQCALLLSIVHWSCGFTASWLNLYTLLVAASAVGAGIGLIVSATVRTAEAAAAILPILLLPMIVLGGILVRVSDLPTITQPLSASMPSRWALEGILQDEAAERPRLGTSQPSASTPTAGIPPPLRIAAPEESETSDQKDMAERLFPRENGRWTSGACLQILVSMGVLAFATVGAILWFRDVWSRK